MHTIRLKRPWQRERVVVGQETDVQRVDVPDETPHATVLGKTIYRRKFNCPTGLEPTDQVSLHVESWVGGPLKIALNDQELPASDGPIEALVTSFLKPHNEVVIEITDTSQASGRLTGEVKLSIQ